VRWAKCESFTHQICIRIEETKGGIPLVLIFHAISFGRKSKKEKVIKMENYKRWEDVPANLKTKTKLGELRLKPANENNPDAVIEIAYCGKRWQRNLYEVNKAISKRKVKVIDPEPLPLNDKNIAFALYTINPAAKGRRDGSVSSYESGAYGLAGLHKSEKEKLYELKDKVIKKAIADGSAKFEGIHKQTRIRKEEVYDDLSEDNFTSHRENVIKTTYLGCYSIENHRFHIILPKYEVNSETLEILDLDGWMSKATSRGKLKIKDAIATLEKYLQT
jgi:hypothetical protein